jgi:hypothetical protein
LEDLPHHPADRTALLAELRRRYEQWLKQGPNDYHLTVSRQCFCDPGTPWRSWIKGGKVALSQGGHREYGESIGPPLRTVEQLFDEATRAAESHADDVFVEFDERFGHPKRILIDSWRGAADDELEWIAELNSS